VVDVVVDVVVDGWMDGCSGGGLGSFSVSTSSVSSCGISRAVPKCGGAMYAYWVVQQLLSFGNTIDFSPFRLILRRVLVKLGSRASRSSIESLFSDSSVANLAVLRAEVLQCNVRWIVCASFSSSRYGNLAVPRSVDWHCQV
jgi:hypothetical protein